MREISDKPTIFVDLDGTLVIHNYELEVKDDVEFPSTIQYIQELQINGCMIILTTARIDSEIDTCLKMLKRKYNFEFDRVITGLTTGIRYLINDRKNGIDKAIAINIDRNIGCIPNIIKC